MITRITLTVGCIYLLAMLAVFFKQRKMLYFPDKLRLDVSQRMAEHAGFADWTNSTGDHIGWKKLSAATNEHLAVLITHGNAGSAVDRYDYGDSFKSAAACDVYILEYPGYGARPGTPSEAAFCQAADEALALIPRKGTLVIMGESIGTGVAAYLAGTHPERVTGLLLIAPYYALGEVAQYHMKLFPAGLLLRDKFEASKHLRKFHGPVAVVLAELDTV